MACSVCSIPGTTTLRKWKRVSRHSQKTCRVCVLVMPSRSCWMFTATLAVVLVLPPASFRRRWLAASRRRSLRSHRKCVFHKLSGLPFTRSWPHNDAKWVLRSRPRAEIFTHQSRARIDGRMAYIYHEGSVEPSSAQLPLGDGNVDRRSREKMCDGCRQPPTGAVPTDPSKPGCHTTRFGSTHLLRSPLRFLFSSPFFVSCSW